MDGFEERPPLIGSRLAGECSFDLRKHFRHRHDLWIDRVGSGEEFEHPLQDGGVEWQIPLDCDFHDATQRIEVSFVRVAADGRALEGGQGSLEGGGGRGLVAERCLPQLAGRTVVCLRKDLIQKSQPVCKLLANLGRQPLRPRGEMMLHGSLLFSSRRVVRGTV